MATLYLDEALKQAEQDIATLESKNRPLSSKKGRFHPYERSEKRSDNRKQDCPAWKNLGHRGQGKRGRGKASHYTPRPANRVAMDTGKPGKSWKIFQVWKNHGIL